MIPEPLTVPGAAGKERAKAARPSPEVARGGECCEGVVQSVAAVVLVFSFFSTLMFGRFCSTTFMPTPLTLARSSALLKGPFFSRYSTIAWARDRPTPFSSLAMVFASALLMSTGPANTQSGSRSAASPATNDVRYMDDSSLAVEAAPSRGAVRHH